MNCRVICNRGSVVGFNGHKREPVIRTRNCDAEDWRNKYQTVGLDKPLVCVDVNKGDCLGRMHELTTANPIIGGDWDCKSTIENDTNAVHRCVAKCSNGEKLPLSQYLRILMKGCHTDSPQTYTGNRYQLAGEPIKCQSLKAHCDDSLTALVERGSFVGGSTSSTSVKKYGRKRRESENGKYHDDYRPGRANKTRWFYKLVCDDGRRIGKYACRNAGLVKTLYGPNHWEFADNQPYL